MSKYIDADTMIKAMPPIMEWLSKKASTIDIVRCGECKHWNEEDHWCNIRDSYGWDYKADDFCSYGQKGDENVETD